MIWWVITAVVTLLFCWWMFSLWQTGKFKRTVRGMRVVIWMIALEIFGLLLMGLAVVLFLIFPGYETFALSDTLLRIGLICAIPPALFLLVYLLTSLLGAEEVTFQEESKVVDQEWFVAQIEEKEEGSNKADELIIRLEAQLSELLAQIRSLEERLREKDDQIAKLLEKGDAVDTEKLATLEREKQELEKEHSELTQGQQEAQSEKEEIKRERELINAERARLEEDRQKFEELSAAKEQAQVEVETATEGADGSLIQEYEKQIQALREEQIRKTYELESELDSLRGELAHTQEVVEAQQQMEEATEEELGRLRAEIAEERMKQEAENYRREQEIEEKIAIEQDFAKMDALREELDATRQANVEMQEQFIQQENEQLAVALARIQSMEGEKEAKRQRDAERRRAAAARKREILSRENIDAQIKKHYVEFAACFLMDRESYKDRFGLSPYNRIIVNDNAASSRDRVQHVMTNTRDKLYKFAEKLIDVDVFLAHPKLFPMYESLVNEGTSLVRISEKLHLMYLQNHRKDFVRDYRYKEDFENLLVLVSNHYVLSGMDFSTIFQNMPFDPMAVNEQEIATYLDNDKLVAEFEEYFPNYADLGFEDRYQAMAVAFYAGQKEYLTPEKLVNAILKEAEKVAKELRRLRKSSAKPKRVVKVEEPPQVVVQPQPRLEPRQPQPQPEPQPARAYAAAKPPEVEIDPDDPDTW